MSKRTILSSFTALALIVLAVAPNARLPVLAAATPPRALPGHVPDVILKGLARLIGQHPTTDTLSLAIVLQPRNQPGIDSFLQSVNDPSSPQYHHYLTLQQANDQFNPTADQEHAVVDWLQQHGLTITQTFPNHLIVDARGTVAQIDSMLKITIKDFIATLLGKQLKVYSSDTPPIVDGSVADIVRSIVGLNNVTQFHLNYSNGSVASGPPYYPQNFANAYDVTPLWNAGYTGTGQRVGITLWEIPTADQTLQIFANRTGASPATRANGRLNVTQVNDGVYGTTTVADSGEAGMDIESSSGMAPGATIDYYEAPTASGQPTNAGLVDALNLAATATNDLQISSSWGECEGSDTGFEQSTTTVFQNNSLTGHTYLFSTGDSGSSCGSDPAADYPASSPYVLAVGGTKFNGAAQTSYPGESAWKYTACGFWCQVSGNTPEGSGGGYSTEFSRPGWQANSGLSTSNNYRGYPDVSADADPNTGALVCYGTGSACAQIGGTSLASPLWAGMLAVLNQYLSAQGQATAGFVDPTLYTEARSTTLPYTPAFHDITSGTNGAYSAGPGWDAVTGWGSPDLYNLARDMAGGGSAGPPTSTPTNTPSVPTNTPTPTATPKITNTPTSTPNVTNTPTSTPQATNTATSTPKATSTATQTPVPTTASQLIQNGGFENAHAPWQETSTGGYEIIDPSNPHAGRYSAYLCGYYSCTDQIYQSVTLPSSFSKVTLGYWYYMSTTNSSSSCVDVFTSRLQTAGGTLIVQPQQSCNNGQRNTWVYESFDLTSALGSYRGKGVTLLFKGTDGRSAYTNFFVDDVTLNVS